MSEGRVEAGAAEPLVSIVLPTYNRAHFLPRAFESMLAQTLTNWELIVVDDGSTDETREVVARLSAGMPQPVRYLRQENQGPDAARKTGLGLVRGRYVAFFDSDDLWLPQHLAECAGALDGNPDVDWVYAAARRVALPSGDVLSENTFYDGGRPRPFLRLRSERRGALRVIVDPRVLELHVEHGLYAGPQVSLVRAALLRRVAFPVLGCVGDQVLVAVALAAGGRFGYIDAVHVIYHEHEGNVSLATAKSLDRQIAILRDLARGLEEFRNAFRLRAEEARAVSRRLANVYFWEMGYPLARYGRFSEAVKYLRAGLRLSPWNLWFWKTYALTRIREAVRSTRGSCVRPSGSGGSSS